MSIASCLAQKPYAIVGKLSNPKPGEIICLKNANNGQMLDNTEVSATGGFAFRGVVAQAVENAIRET